MAVIQAGLQQVCNEMDVAFTRSAFSPVIAEADDRSSGIYDKATGALISQGEFGLPVFVGTMQYSTAELTRLIAEGFTAPPEPGDIYVVNDPYLGGTHLMDVRFALPFYHRGELFCWLQNTGHWPDIGGAVPGGFSAHATEVEQEGLRLPPVKLFKRGEMDREIFQIISSNIRVADQRIGDIKAQAAALKVGERRLTRAARPLRRGDGRGGDRRDFAARVKTHARAHRDDPRRHLPLGGLRRFRRRGERAAEDRARRHQGGGAAAFRFFRQLAALPRADELGRRDHLFRRLSRRPPHFSGHAAECRRLRAAGHRAAGGHFPRRPLSAPRLGLRGGGLAAHRRGGVFGARAGDP